MEVITIEEHWTTPALDRILRAHDDSVTLNDHVRSDLLDVGDQRVAAMDASGVDLQILSLTPPGTHCLPPKEAIALSREANDRATEAVARHPTRLRAMTTLPMTDPEAAVAELTRTANSPAHVGLMTYGRTGTRHLDDPAYDDLLATAAALRRPIFIHPQIPPPEVRAASYQGFTPALDLALSTYGWGWHQEAGLAALRLILRGTFDRHPDLQIVLGHWGEHLLPALDRANTLTRAAHLDRRVSDYFHTNIHITTSGMLTPRLLHHALTRTTPDRILLSADYPFHRLTPETITDFLAALPNPEDRLKITTTNAQRLFGLNREDQPRH
ncbi:putative TIM-barrel fold metal-dependent hydrolase [Crossiella equi]|uniref:TIM-barrel fold metal-dependent hydrolase n=2 Tax=Crossiella equi TaxID=130796 RepID=A0ABS5A7K8_9PSEU|nr:putative TIM-barrel fold metal-dependent hydrolase [Crossiella equi]